MKPRSTTTDALELFQAHFDQLLNPEHPLVQLAAPIDWEGFDRKFGQYYCEDNGAPANRPAAGHAPRVPGCLQSTELPSPVRIHPRSRINSGVFRDDQVTCLQSSCLLSPYN